MKTSRSMMMMRKLRETTTTMSWTGDSLVMLWESSAKVSVSSLSANFACSSRRFPSPLPLCLTCRRLGLQRGFQEGWVYWQDHQTLHFKRFAQSSEFMPETRLS
ncbi:unnamed protein product [Choristocarpus tenellus]